MAIYPEPAEIIPHRAPILMLRCLRRVDESGAVATSWFASGDYGVEGERIVAGALIECLAQTMAAALGFAARNRGWTRGGGMLVGIEDFVVLAPARAGREVEIEVKICRRLGPFCLAEGSISQDGAIVARGSLKLYIEDDGGNAPQTA